MRELLTLFSKPSHYTGNEEGVIIKDPAAVKLHLALAFPDTYEIGMSYLGHKILYGIINANPEWAAERVMAPEKDAAQILRQRNVPLATLETDTPMHKLDAVGFAITHELCYTDVLHMLDLSHIPLRSQDRGDSLSDYPVIMAGGGAIPGAEPLMPFIDLACIGDGEEMMPEVLTLLAKAKEYKASRAEFLLAAAKIPGIYIPSFFEENNGTLKSLLPDYRPTRRIVADLNKAIYPVKQIAPVGAIHNRLALEIARGCSRGCRFCHAGIVYRPVRERNLEVLANLLNDSLDQTGFEEVSFLSLSAGDFSALKTLYNKTYERCAAEQISLALPSLRAGSVDNTILQRMAALRRTGITIAPEAGSQRLRDVINKGISEDDILKHAQSLLACGWRQVKLYFMIGLPTETDADLEAIVELCRKVRDAGGRGQPKLQVTAALSTFVPKPFTPFQWEKQIDLEETKRRVHFVLERVKSEKNIKLRWHDPEVSYLEGLLSRGGRQMADVVELAYKKGAVYCSWAESFNLTPWLKALAECGIDPGDMLAARTTEAMLPWDHLESGVSREFLLRERQRAYEGKITPDCRYSHCNFCGVCDTAKSSSLLRKNLPGEYKNILVFTERDQAINDKTDFQENLPETNKQLAIKAAQYRVWHTKRNNFVWWSQLELQAVIDRVLRRAKIPLSFSQGFHPLPLISFGRALPVGVESDMEWFAITLNTVMDCEKLQTAINQFMPADLNIVKIEVTDKKNRTEQAISETFALDFHKGIFPESMRNFENFAKLHEYEFSRETKKGIKTENIRPFLQNWRANQEDGSIIFSTSWQNGYLSPLLLIRQILAVDKNQPAPYSRFIKIGQLFTGGRGYGVF